MPFFFGYDVLYIRIVRTKRAGKRKVEDEGVNYNVEGCAKHPSEALNKMFIKCIRDFYESETTMSLESKYVRYNEAGIKKFKSEMWQRFMDAVAVLEFQHEMDNNGFDKFLRNKVHDVL